MFPLYNTEICIVYKEIKDIEVIKINEEEEFLKDYYEQQYYQPSANSNIIVDL